MKYPFERRLRALLAKLEQAPECRSRMAAHELLCELWLQVHIAYGASEPLIKRLRARRLCEEHGWQALDADPCYWESAEQPLVRIYLHNNGAIVIQSAEPGESNILFNLPGKILQTHSA